MEEHDKKFDPNLFGLARYEKSPVPFTRRFSWPALASMVAESPVGEENWIHDHHWKSTYHHCGLCNLGFDFVFHLGLFSTSKCRNPGRLRILNDFKSVYASHSMQSVGLVLG